MDTVLGYYPMLEDLVDDHQYIRRSIKRIEKLIQIKTGVHMDLERRNALIGKCIHMLHQKIKLHFEMEELHGVFEDLIDMKPGIAKEINALYREHRTMLWKLGKIDGLGKVLSDKSHEKENFDNLKRQFHEFVKTLGDHEATEHLLISEVRGEP